MTECSNTHRFDEFKRKYEGLTPGEKSDIKRVSTPEKTRNCLAFYKIAPDGESPKQWARIIFMLPWFASGKGVNAKRSFEVKRNEDPSCECESEKNGAHEVPQIHQARHTNGIGEIMALSDVPVQCVKQMVFSRYPRDIERLRRIARMCVSRGFSSIDWSEFGKTLYFWGEKQKELIFQTYCREMARLGKIKGKTKGRS